MKDLIKTSKKSQLKKDLLNLLKSLVSLHSAYVISINNRKGKQVTYLSHKSKQSRVEAIYTLLIVGNESLSKNLDDFMEELYNKMEQRCKVYVIYCSISNIMERIDMGDNFLTRVLKETPCIYKEDNALSRYSQYGLMHHVSIYKDIKTIWKNRMERAVYLFSVIDVIHEEEEPLSKLAVMHNAMQQVCLGMLYVFWEYKPHHYTLSYLLHLCTAFTDLPHIIFPQTTYGLQRQYYMLCNASEIMHFKGINDFTLSDVDKVLKRCKQFHKEAYSLGLNQLKQLKAVHCKAISLS